MATAGKLPATVATPLSVVLTELLQNAVDHGFPEGSGGGNGRGRLHNDGSEVRVEVIDDGLGVPAGFDLDQATGLGLVIVRTLVTTELAGKIEMRAPTDDELIAAGLEPPGAALARSSTCGCRLTVPAATARCARRVGRALSRRASVAARGHRSTRDRSAARATRTVMHGLCERRQTAARCRRGRLAADLAPLLLAGAAPDARVLVGLEGVLEAVALHRALAAHLLGPLDLHERVARGADREEQIRIGVATDGVTPPAVVARWPGRGSKQGWSRCPLLGL